MLKSCLTHTLGKTCFFLRREERNGGSLKLIQLCLLFWKKFFRLIVRHGSSVDDGVEFEGGEGLLEDVQVGHTVVHVNLRLGLQQLGGLVASVTVVDVRHVLRNAVLLEKSLDGRVVGRISLCDNHDGGSLCRELLEEGDHLGVGLPHSAARRIVLQSAVEVKGHHSGPGIPAQRSRHSGDRVEVGGRAAIKLHGLFRGGGEDGRGGVGKR